MSDVPFDPSTAADLGGQKQPSEEEIRAYLSQLRQAPVDQVLAEVVNALLNAAQVKVGRRDGRLLIDITAAITDTIRGQVPDELTTQLDQALTQLRMAQVEGEQQVAQAKAGGQHEAGDLEGKPEAAPDAAETGGAAGPAGPPPAQAGPAATPPPASGGGAASRLWVPGR
ncbi:MAG: hypothetical protein ACNA8R_00090 [Nitriliruptoraceae bacterium]